MLNAPTNPVPTPAASIAPGDKWAANRHRLYLEAGLKALCDLACRESGLTLSTLLQRAVRRYVRKNAALVRRRLAELPEGERHRLGAALEGLFAKTARPSPRASRGPQNPSRRPSPFKTRNDTN